MRRGSKLVLLASLLVGFALLDSPDAVSGGEMCDTGPPCQCECLDAWDECAEGLPTQQAQEKCDPAYEECWEENCGLN